MVAAKTCSKNFLVFETRTKEMDKLWWNGGSPPPQNAHPFDRRANLMQRRKKEE
jgi:hypothetical protein